MIVKELLTEERMSKLYETASSQALEDIAEVESGLEEDLDFEEMDDFGELGD